MFISNECVSAQPTLKEQNRIKDFGKSLKKYGKKSVADSKNNEKNPVADEELIRVKTDLVVNDILVVNQIRLRKEIIINSCTESA